MSSQTYTRTRVRDTRLRDPGPYEAIVVSHLDPLSMGTLEVEIVRNSGSGSTPERSGQLITVRYLTPFYGVTPVKGLTSNEGFQFTQKSYGMWMVPPDVGTRVLVIFAEGNAAYGYWIGCIPEIGMNFMMPSAGQAATTLTTAAKPEHLKESKLPVGEYNKLIEKGSKVDPTLFDKPYNKDFTEVLEVQGLINDEARGTTTSSARREAPSMVFGISTPGPLDKRNQSPTAKYGSDTGSADYPYNRLGGTSFVMDDGDERFIRATHAADGPPIYINRENKEAGGDETIPQNEHVRIRTRTGHQILLHNSEDLIYIANARGTAWIELTSDGKIDIYAYDSISVTSHNDINFTAERDFNIDAGRNINMRAQARYSDGKETSEGIDSGRIQIESAFNMNIEVGKDLKTTVFNDHDIVVGKDMRVLTVADYHLRSQANIYQQSDNSTHEIAGQSWYRQAGSNINDISAAAYFNASAAETNFTTGGDYKLSAGGAISNSSGSSIHHSASSGVHLLGGSIVAGDAAVIHWNSGKAVGGPAPGSASPPTPPTPAEPVVPLEQITLPFIIPGAQQAVPYRSILARSPQHEPWPQHENYDPKSFTPADTDREAPGELGLPDRVLTPDTFRKNKDGLSASVFVPAIAAANKGAFGGGGDGASYGGSSDYGRGITRTPVTGTFVEPQGAARDIEAYLETFLDANGPQLPNWGPMAKAAIMAQCKQETGNFRWLRELGNDSYFTRYDPGRHREAIRNGNTQPGDGARYKGRGFIQLTWKNNYRAAGQFIGVDLVANPQLAEQKETAAKLVVWYFKTQRPRIGRGNKWSDIRAVTQAVNGGYNHIENRSAYFAAYKRKYGVT